LTGYKNQQWYLARLTPEGSLSIKLSTFTGIYSLDYLRFNLIEYFLELESQLILI